MVTVLSPVWGLRRVLVYGAQKSRKAVRAPLYTEAVFHVYNNRERNLCSLVDLNIISIHENVLSGLEANLSSSLMCEIIMDQRGGEAPAYYTLLTSCLDRLDADNYQLVVIQFILRALALAGQGLSLSVCPVCGRPYGADEILGFSNQVASPCCHICDNLSGSLILPPNARRYLTDSLALELPQALSLGLSGNMRRRIMRYMIRSYRFITASALKSDAALLELEGDCQ